MSKPTWNDLHAAHQADLKRVYRLTDRQFEFQVKRHLDGANAKERREFFQMVYDNRAKSL